MFRIFKESFGVEEPLRALDLSKDMKVHSGQKLSQVELLLLTILALRTEF